MPRRVYSVAPIRINDLGGWTDTWFAQHGRVFNMAVSPFVEVQIDVLPRSSQASPIWVTAENYGHEFAPTEQRRHHPLIEAAIELLRPPVEFDYHVHLYSDMPPGASTGTSAAMSVALVGALDRLTPGRMTTHELAQTAFRIETEMLGRQSGIQDQMGSAYGGLNWIEIFDYPQCRVHRLEAPDDVWWELEHRLLLIYLGKTHDSSQVHQTVIRDLQNTGPDHPVLEELRACADEARDAVLGADFDRLGRAMDRNTDAQRSLHPTLVSRDAEDIFALGRHFGAVGGKVNGAGGDGGSVTLLCGPDLSQRRKLVDMLNMAARSWRSIPVRLSRMGARIWVR